MFSQLDNLCIDSLPNLRPFQLDRLRTMKLRMRPKNILASMACRHFDRWDASRLVSMSLHHKGRGIRTRRPRMIFPLDNSRT
jgi:hypothetical protein